MESIQDAIDEYAFSCDRETIIRFRQLCETLAEHMTKLISQMERIECETGYLFAPINSYSARHTNLQKTIIVRQEIFDFIHHDFEFEHFEKHCHRFTLDYLHKIIRFRENRRCATCRHEYVEDICANTIEEQIWLHHMGCPKCDLRYAPTDQFIGSLSLWQKMRRNFWNAADRLHRFGIAPKERAGRPKDVATWELLRWAKIQSLSVDSIARRLVEAGLDRNPKGTQAVRVRTEKKRLSMLKKSVDLWDKNETPYRRWNRIARSVGMKSP